MHDYEPGIADNGLFWTIPIADDAVTFDLAAGTASYALRDIPIPDYHNAANGLAQGPSDPAIASFEVRWQPGPSGRRFTQRDEANRFTGEYSEGISTITWTARQAGFSFVSNPSDASQSQFAIVGHERNGVYFDAAPSPSPPTQPRDSSGTVAGTTSEGRLPATGAAGTVVETVAGSAVALGGLGLWLAAQHHPRSASSIASSTCSDDPTSQAAANVAPSSS